MAIDPTEVAEQQEQQQRINIAGAPKEFAKGPDREGEFEIASGASRILNLLSKLDSPSPTPKKPTDSEVVSEILRCRGRHHCFGLQFFNFVDDVIQFLDLHIKGMINVKDLTWHVLNLIPHN